MTQNPHLGSDALAFLNSIVPDTPETRLMERQERFRIALTQAMRDARKQAGLTQLQLAQELGVGQSWVSKLESANNDHTFESVIAYLNALKAKLETSIILNGRKIAVVATNIEITREKADVVNDTSLDHIEDLQPQEESKSPEFTLISSDKVSKCHNAQALLTHSHERGCSLAGWGA